MALTRRIDAPFHTRVSVSQDTRRTSEAEEEIKREGKRRPIRIQSVHGFYLRVSETILDSPRVAVDAGQVERGEGRARSRGVVVVASTAWWYMRHAGAFRCERHSRVTE